MNASAALRGQLADHRPAPAAAAPDPALAAIDPNASSLCFHAGIKAVGLKVVTAHAIATFPYSHFLFAHLATNGALIVRFVTHRVIAKGRNLEILLDELTSQRLDLLRALPKRMNDRADHGGVWIEHIDLNEVREDDKLPT
jgi:hypothetical protein